jgi:hypothetical protein
LFRSRVCSSSDRDGREEDGVESPGGVNVTIIYLFEEAREVVWIFGRPTQHTNEESGAGEDQDPGLLRVEAK